ncbi:MAG: von Willebrand factor type A domain-containing protein [Candidatus Omnitrophota bacterium]|jgi:Ca-activated chloride channel family protein
MMDHEKMQILISAYIDQELSESERQAVEDHLVECEECQRFYQDVRKISSSLKTWNTEALSPDLEQKIVNQVRAIKSREGRHMRKFNHYIPYNAMSTLIICLLVLTVSLRVYLKRNVQTALQEAQDDAFTGMTSPEIKMARGVLEEKPAIEKAALPPSSNAVLFDQPQPVSFLEKGEKRKAVMDAITSARQGGDVRNEAIYFKGQPLPAETPQRVAMVEGRPDFAKNLESGGVARQYAADESRSRQAVASKEALAFPAASMVAAPAAERHFSAGQSGEGYAYTDKTASLRPGLMIVEPDKDWEEPSPYYGKREEANTEQYDRIYENNFLAVLENPLSTFSIDVDTASYANIRRYLNHGQMPPKDAVRIEEMVNYFVYDYPQPDGEDPFSIVTETAPCPWNPAHQLALIGIKAKELSGPEMPASNLVFLIDVSGSMNKPEKLPLLKSALRLMVERLRPEERISIVTYAGQAALMLDSASGYDKGRILQAIDRLEAGGSTAGEQGIQLAYRMARQNFIPEGNNRVILATDGDFNVGVSSDGDLTRMVEVKRGEGIFLTVLGFGTGNYKDAKMEKLADKGNGNYYYIDTLQEAQKVLVAELGSLLFPVAKDVKIQVEFNPSTVKAYRLIGYENRLMAKEDFNDDTKDAGELGAGHTVTAFYEIVPADSEEEHRKTDPLQYMETVVHESADLMTVKLRYKELQHNTSQLITRVVTAEQAGDPEEVEESDNFRFGAAVAEFGLLLRGSAYKGQASYLDVLHRAKASLEADAWGYRQEFIRLVEKAAVLDRGY